MPETGVDPINIAAHIYLALQEITARELPAKTPAIVTMGKFSAGHAPNIIPQEAVIEGTIRTFDRDVTALILRRIGEIADATARAFRGSASVEELASAPPLKNDEALTEQMARCAEMLFGEKSVYRLREGGMGSEDFASYTYELPCAYLLLGAGTAQEETEDGEPSAQLLDGSAARRLCGAACRLDVDQALDLLLEQRRAARAGQEEAAIRRMTRTYLEGCRA